MKNKVIIFIWLCLSTFILGVNIHFDLNLFKWIYSETTLILIHSDLLQKKYNSWDIDLFLCFLAGFIATFVLTMSILLITIWVEKNKKVKIKSTVILIFWILSLTLALYIIFRLWLRFWWNISLENDLLYYLYCFIIFIVACVITFTYLFIKKIYALNINKLKENKNN